MRDQAKPGASSTEREDAESIQALELAAPPDAFAESHAERAAQEARKTTESGGVELETGSPAAAEVSEQQATAEDPATYSAKMGACEKACEKAC